MNRGILIGLGAVLAVIVVVGYASMFTVHQAAQALVLQSYAEGFTDNSDVAIELPTGGGKTLIALLIAEAWRREGRTVAILSANKTLARQLAEEADSLGIPRVVMEGSAASIPATRTRAFQRAEAVAVMNYWVYFNQNPVVDPADLLIMDDAHLMEECLHSLYSVEIEKIDHPDLFRELASELLARFPEYSVLADALDDEAPATKPPELLSFIDQIAVAARFTEIIDASPALQADQDLAFRWHRLRGSLQDANIYLSSNSLWIRPYVYPLIANPHYDGARQRIYMSATIGIPGDLQRRLGIRALTQIPVAPEHAEKTFGRRLIVLNRIDNEDLPERVTEVVRAALQVHPKSVWLCSSKSNANKFQALFSTWLDENGFPNQPTWVLTPTGDEIDRFKESQSGHLFVGGRFDGMDFAGDQCRLVVLTTLPRSINIQEEFISAYLRDSGFMKSRLNQRIVQAMGRCNRSENDYAVYVLADKRFATHFSRESNRVGIPKNIQAEIDIAQDSAEADLGQTVRDVRDFLGGNFERYDRNLATSLESLPPAQAIANVTDTSDNEVIGWTALFDSQNYVLAAQRFERCTDTARQDGLLEISALHGWNWSKAVYLESMRGVPGARARALAILDQALHRGGRSAWFNRMRTSLVVAGRLVLGLAVLGGIDSEAGGQCAYEVTQIIEPPACGDIPFFNAIDITDTGEVGGAFTCFLAPQAATWDAANGVTPLPFLSGFTQAGVGGLNSINEVVGFQFSSTLTWRAVIWQNGVPSRLPDWPGTTLSFAAAINRDGWITGYWGNSIFGPGEAAIIWKPDGSMVNLNDDLPGNSSHGLDINDHGHVTGWFGFSPSPQPFIWDSGQVTELPLIPGATMSKGLAINNHSQVAGTAWIPIEGSSSLLARAFFWDGLSTIDLGTLPGFENSAAHDINDVAQIVGVSSVPGKHAFLWRDGVMLDLNSFLPPEFVGSSMTATAITRYGEILLTGGNVGFILSPIGSGPGDIDNNCSVNVSDLLLLISEWGETISVADINLDGSVNVTDLLMLLGDWG
ncbi:MAG: hypothetical protein IIA64_11140 [Planctomycetes bacterium]|nr:hypothetical protein [Planctomycetota bacterium]